MIVETDKLYDFETARRSELNEGLKHTFQLSLGSIGFLVFLLEKFEKADFDNWVVFFSFWAALAFSSLTLALCMTAYLAFKTAFPNSALEVELYRRQLLEHDPDTAEEILQNFLQNRSIENASKNADRNRSRSRLSFLGRISLGISALPLMVLVICYAATRM